MRSPWAAAVVAGFCVASLAQTIPPEDYFVISDLQLVSHEAVLEGGLGYAGPTCTAIVLAWFAEQGFPALLPDLNGDEVVDEQDTIQLAGDLVFQMEAEPLRGVSDPLLVDVLARYVAERYPDKFLIKVYDDDFREEYQVALGQPFSPDLYPHVALELYPHPTQQDYREEVLWGSGVILGLGQAGEANRHFVGRSFRFQEQPEGWPIDLVDTGDDPREEGLQGQVLPTYMVAGEPYWLVAYGGWQPLEFMLALAPRSWPETAWEGLTVYPYGCPEEAFGHDVTTVETEFGSFQVEECALHADDHDLYIYVVRNIDFLYHDMGIIDIVLPNTRDFTTLGQWGMPGCLMNLRIDTGWSWTFPPLGILPGEAAVVAIAVPAPTEDVAYTGVTISYNPLPGDSERYIIYHFTTTGPGGEVGCPDLRVVRATGCWFQNVQKQTLLGMEVWVENAGSAPARDVELRFTVLGRQIYEHLPGTILPGTRRRVEATLLLGIDAYPPFHVRVEVDPKDLIEECDEANNTTTVKIDYPDCCS